MKTTIIAIAISTLFGTTACKSVQTAVDAGLTLTGDVCQLLSQDDPSAPQWAKVSCQVEGAAAPIVLNLPWASWQAMLTASAKAPSVATPVVAPAMKKVVR
jgi:hypothetical protein